MCQFSEPDVNDNTPASMAQRTELYDSHSTTSSDATSKTQTAGICSPCTRGWWHSTLSSTNRAFVEHLPCFSSQRSALSTNQQRMHRLMRLCTQACLYPNPASPNSKAALKTSFDALVRSMDSLAFLHRMNTKTLEIYTFPVQAVIDNLRISGRECHCAECKSGDESCAAAMRTEIQGEVDELMDTIDGVRKGFEELEGGFLGKWDKGGKQELQGMIDALPDPQGMRGMAVVKKYFPRQVREMEAGARPTVFAMRGSAAEMTRCDSGCDSGCEASP
ncbi:hypothetical protein OPT61_g3962 [Boeremia exigua]|uniref:Uncharacterized protein n=1 Tax=Boeremia exigua TaxID=749465 RepID=A0ACC2IFT8_9PLEO|nr:hypothetical protein OPT61_g3962 [Boeremia exigua]